MIKDRNSKDLTEAEEIKKRWQEYKELHKKNLHDPDNHHGVITHLEPDILECEVKWAFSSVQFSSVTQSCPTLCDPMNRSTQASLSITNSWSLPRLMSINLVMPSSHLILCHPLLLPPPSPPSIRVFSNESTRLMRWPKYWSFSFSISPSKEHPGLISFKMDWLDLLAVQGTLKSLL